MFSTIDEILAELRDGQMIPDTHRKVSNYVWGGPLRVNLVIKDNQIVFVREPKTPTREVKFRFQDREVQPGVHYYYARVIQEDRNMAWVSPIWVNVELEE